MSRVSCGARESGTWPQEKLEEEEKEEEEEEHAPTLTHAASVLLCSVYPTVLEDSRCCFHKCFHNGRASATPSHSHLASQCVVLCVTVDENEDEIEDGRLHTYNTHQFSPHPSRHLDHTTSIHHATSPKCSSSPPQCQQNQKF
ncbi:hypothetical protein E2C01_032683 [Portunus trituberculatus]|uniref:Uncharacterized protein n=1 Tax=Portunus trituberculatus TaxID=210409 RepID=A0A5B7EVX0_PORTR|nr:hypothetical protein [Portunus trituberculatus]